MASVLPMLKSCALWSFFYRRDFSRSHFIGYHIRNPLHSTCYIQTDSSIHRTPGRGSEKKQAKVILHQNLDSVARKLKMPSLKPTYLSMPEHSGSQILWKTILTLKWPDKSCFEATGRNKKESEELAAKRAVENLCEAGVLSPDGRLLHGVSSHRMTNSSDIPVDVPANGPVSLGGTSVDVETLQKVEEKFPNFKSTLLNCFVKVSSHLKDANYIVRPSFKRFQKRGDVRWQASYNFKWPEPQQFSGIGSTRAEAERWSILLAIHWLLERGYLHPLGYPILYSKEEIEQWKITRSNPLPLRLSENLKSDLAELLKDYDNLKPLLAEERRSIQASAMKTAVPIDEENVENLEEEQQLEESIGLDEAFANTVAPFEVDERAVSDPITGYKCFTPTPEDQIERNNELYLSAQNRLILGKGPVVPALPIAENRSSILELIQNNRVIVLSGDTGCGKSTQMPQYILDSYALNRNGFNCNIIVTQPRRLAAVSLAQTVAKHRGERLGESVGYQVRLNAVLPKKQGGRILFCSTGILLRRLQANPDLTGVSHLIIDEVHERDCLTDFSLIIIKDLIQKNPNVKVILMSASLNADLLSRYFNGAPLVHVPGRAFPVQKYSLPDIARQLSTVVPFRGTEQKPIVNQDLIVKLIRYIDRTKPPQGAILCFLPGWAEIKSLHSKLKEHFPYAGSHWILPVHSRLSQAEQEKIFDKPPDGIRKIVLATNIAETSLTINDVVYVIDPGVHKELRYNPRRGSSIMENQWISQANVRQRAGRAGRVQPGESYHLFPPEVFEEMSVFPQAEILRTPLEKVVIDIKAYNEDLRVADFLSRALEPPSGHAIKVAVKELEMIGVLDENEKLTALGRRIAQFSTHPRLSKALVFATLFRCLDPVASIVAGLSSSREGWSLESTGDNGKQAIRQAKRELHPNSDHLAIARLVSEFRTCQNRREEDEFCSQTKSNSKALHFLKGVRRLLVGHLCDAGLLADARDPDQQDHPVNQLSSNEEIVKAALLMGFCDTIVTVRKGKLVKGVLKLDEEVIHSEKHGPVHIASDSVNSGEDVDSDYLMYFNGVFSSERRAFVVRDTTPVRNLTTALAAGKSLEICQESDPSDNRSVLAIDSKPHLKFVCSEEDGEFLLKFRHNMLDVCDYILSTVGLREPTELTKLVGLYHTRQIKILAALLSDS